MEEAAGADHVAIIDKELSQQKVPPGNSGENTAKIPCACWQRIIIGLYALFLGNIMVKDLQNLAGEGARFLTDNWIMAGVLSVTTFTTPKPGFMV